MRLVPSILLWISCVCGLVDTDMFVNEKVESSIVLGTHDATQIVEIKGRALVASTIYDIVIPQSSVENLAYLTVKSKDENLRIFGPEIQGQFAHFHVEVDVDEGSSVYLKAIFHWINVAEPFPKTIVQSDPNQYYKYLGNVYFASPYLSQTQKLTVKLPTRKPLRAVTSDLEPFKKDQSKLTYGPYDDIEPYSEHTLLVLFHNQAAALFVSKYVKSIEIGYWQPILSVQESFVLHHRGAVIKGQFSQIDHKRSTNNHPQTNVVKELTSTLPANAYDVYLKDLVGNITTSNLRYEKNRALFQIRPRFPLFGGWKFTWWHGYKIPRVGYLTEIEEKVGGKLLEIKISMLPSIKKLTVENAELRIILPEGATDIKVEAPFDVEQFLETTYTYFDSVGRPTIVFKRTNLVDAMNQKFKIKYVYSSRASLIKPAVISSVIVGFFTLIWVLSKLDLSITPNPEKLLKKATDEVNSALSSILTKEQRAIHNLDVAFDALKEDLDVKKFKESINAQISIMETGHDFLNGLSNDPKYQFFEKRLQSIISCLKDRKIAWVKFYDSVAEYYSRLNGAEPTETQKNKVRKAIDEMERDITGCTDKLDKLLIRAK